MKPGLFIATLAASLSSLGLQAASPAPLPSTTPWDLPSLMTTPEFSWHDSQSAVKSLRYNGLQYQKHPTEVFAYYASPADFGMTDGPYPAMVLVHGGGGAAFKEWARLWASKGYAAIAMDLAGKGAERTPLANGGPDHGHEQKFATIDEPVNNQWTYHAVANVLLAHSLIRSFDEVDANRTGVTGISWGGYLTCIVAGVDDRFQFAMPVYGCGFLRDNSVWKDSEFGKMTNTQSDRWHQLWDPARYLPSARMPVIFLNGTNDFAYPVDSHARSSALVRTETLFSLQLRMPHGHLFNFPEFFHFADQHIRQGVPLPKISSLRIRNNKIRASVSSRTKLVSARLHYTLGPQSENKARSWITRPLTITGSRIHGGAPPVEATAYYVDVRDERKALTSSAFIIP